jgi:hypothetical protein
MISGTSPEHAAMADSPLALLTQARHVLENYLFDGETCRDDVAEICQKIDELLGGQTAIPLQSNQERAAA